MVETKDGKMDKEYFKNMIQKSELIEEKLGLSGIKLDFIKLTYQIMKVSFKIKDLVGNKTYEINFKVGFSGCDIIDKNEVFPVKGWWAYERKD